MKIELKKGYVAVLKEDSGEIVAVFKPSPYANRDMMTAVASHFDVASVGMDTDTDFTQGFDYEQPYTFVLYKGTDEEEYVTLTLTYEPIY